MSGGGVRLVQIGQMRCAMNDKSVWLSHIFYNGWKGFFKYILCLMLTQVFMLPFVLLVAIPVGLLKRMGVEFGEGVETAALFVAIVLSLPFGFYYASRLLKIQV